MKTRGCRTTWRRTAGFATPARFRFGSTERAGMLIPEASQTRTRHVSNCQNRYPSPSRGSDQNSLIGPARFRIFQRGFAGFSTDLNDVIAYQPENCLLTLRGKKFHNIRGKSSCIRQTQSQRSPLFSRSRPAIRVQTSNAPLLAALPGVSWQTPLTKANAFRAHFSVVSQARFPTTSKGRSRQQTNKTPARTEFRTGFPSPSRRKVPESESNRSANSTGLFRAAARKRTLALDILQRHRQALNRRPECVEVDRFYVGECGFAHSTRSWQVIAFVTLRNANVQRLSNFLAEFKRETLKIERGTGQSRVVRRATTFFQGHRILQTSEQVRISSLGLSCESDANGTADVARALLISSFEFEITKDFSPRETTDCDLCATQLHMTRIGHSDRTEQGKLNV